MLRAAGLVLLACLLGAPGFGQDTGADIYRAKCAMCHGADGRANTPIGRMIRVPSLRSPDLVAAKDSELIDATKSGKGKMAAYEHTLTDSQIDDVIAYIRTLQK